MKNHIVKGIYAGFIATLVLSLLMVIKAKLGMLPQMNAIKMLATMSHTFMGTPVVPIVGWFLHFLIGSIFWGVSFALLYHKLPTQASVTKGLLFGTIAWALMMIVVMPMAGAGLFGLHIGIGVPIATLILHWVYGAVLGVIYAKFMDSSVFTSHTHA